MADPYVPEALAKKRFLAINLVRVAGVTMILLGILVSSGSLDWPGWLAWPLIGFGMFDAFIFPLVLARRWKSGGRGR